MKRMCFLTKKILLTTFVFFFVGMTANSANTYAASLTVKTGIATPQNDIEVDNTEILRERAIRNAIEMALLEVKGITVSSEKANIIREKDTVNIRDGVEMQEQGQESRFSDSAMTRTEGHVRVVEIIEEARVGIQYHVKVKLEVLEQDEASEKYNAGYFWGRINKPGLSMIFRESVNNVDGAEEDAYTLRYMRDVLAKNDLHVAYNKLGKERYKIKVTQDIDASSMNRYGTVTAHCNLTFQITDTHVDRILSEASSKHGPQAGFTLETAKTDCLKNIAPEFSRKLVRSLANIFNDSWNMGDEYEIHIKNLPGNYLTQAVELISNVFQVKTGNMQSYNDGLLIVVVRYQGISSELPRAVVSAFDELGHEVVPVSAKSNVIGLHWVESSDF